jgi:translocation and assembly module TamA
MRRAVRALLAGFWFTASCAYAQQPEIIVDPGGVSPAALQAIDDAVAAIARLADDQDGGEIERLRRRAREACLVALASQGYFSAQVTLQSGTDVGGETWDISINPGPRATVASVQIAFTGGITASEYAARVDTLRDHWQLAVGQPFINSDWNQAKSALLDGVATRDFLLARIIRSEAEVDAEQAQVHLWVDIDSGPRVRLGPLVTQGLKRVPETLIRRYVRYDEGDAYNQEMLNEWQQALQTTAFFRGAFVSLPRPDGQSEPMSVGKAQAPGSIATSPITPADDAAVAGSAPVHPNGDIVLPVQVRVVEAPAKRAAVALGVDDEAGVRFETVYRQHVVFGQPITLDSGVGVDRLRQRAFADFRLPPDERGNEDSIGVLAQHSDIEGLAVTRYGMGVARSQNRQGAGDSRVQYETRWGLLATHDRVDIKGGEAYGLPALTATVDWLRRDVDNQYDPREGNLIALGGGAGVTLNRGQPYVRARLRAQKWWPVSERDVLTVRGEVGRIWSSDDTQVPDDFGFRTGGARSVRGYRYQSLGIRRADATVGAPTLLVGSIEYDHYFNARYGVGVFVDVGDAAPSFVTMKMAVGYGIGARVRTPAGPLFLDVAYGQRPRDLSIHFSLGIAF